MLSLTATLLVRFTFSPTRVKRLRFSLAYVFSQVFYPSKSAAPLAVHSSSPLRSSPKYLFVRFRSRSMQRPLTACVLGAGSENPLFIPHAGCPDGRSLSERLCGLSDPLR